MGKGKQVTVIRNWVNDELLSLHTTRAGNFVRKKLKLTPGQVVQVAWKDGTCTSGTIELEDGLYERGGVALPDQTYRARDIWRVATVVRDTKVKIDIEGLDIIID